MPLYFDSLAVVPIRHLPLLLPLNDYIHITNESWKEWDKCRLMNMFVHYFHCTYQPFISMVDCDGVNAIIELTNAQGKKFIHFCVYPGTQDIISFKEIVEAGVFHDRLCTVDGFLWSNKVFVTYLSFDDASIDLLKSELSVSPQNFDHCLGYKCLLDARGIKYYNHSIPLERMLDLNKYAGLLIQLDPEVQL